MIRKFPTIFKRITVSRGHSKLCTRKRAMWRKLATQLEKESQFTLLMKTIRAQRLHQLKQPFVVELFINLSCFKTLWSYWHVIVLFFFFFFFFCFVFVVVVFFHSNHFRIRSVSLETHSHSSLDAAIDKDILLQTKP